MYTKLVDKAKLWESRSDSENTSINCLWLSKYAVDCKRINLNITPWVFSNIPKTAGKALDNYLTQGFALSDILSINSGDLLHFPQSIYLKKSYPKAVTGQYAINDLLYQLLPDQEIVHLSMMRDPIYRVIFIYNDIATNAYHSVNKSEKAMDFDAFIRQDNSEINNGQSKRFAGMLSPDLEISDKELYEKARFVVDNCFSLVGISEQFKQFYELLGNRCGIRFHNLPPIVRSKLKVQLSDVSDQQLALIKQKNRVDVQLYHYVKSKFEDFLK
ncbi:MAG: sulfotransferase family 2 domain-containing protein [Proteobacteria bacterium]|nr:sulfotransferase family 2 domain-containing protein [Pseudomonadota bacterium]